jgi:hypothetical protein
MEALLEQTHRVEHISHVRRVDEQVSLPQSLAFFRG